MRVWNAAGKRSVCLSIVLMCAVSFAQDHVSFNAGWERGAKLKASVKTDTGHFSGIDPVSASILETQWLVMQRKANDKAN